MRHFSSSIVELSAVTYTVGLALVADTVDPKDIGRCMGFALSGMSFGVLVGPLLGGIVFAKVGYYAVIAMMIGLILVDICLPFGFVEKRVAREWLEARAHKVDERTRLLEESPVSPEPALGYHTQSQTLDKDNSHLRTLLKCPQILAALWGVIVQLTILASFDAVLTVFLEETFGWNSLGVGLAFLALALPVTLLGPVAGTISDHIGPRWPAVMGCLLTAPPLVLLQLIAHPGTSQTVALVVLLVLIGKPLVTIASLVLMCSGSTLAFIISPLAADLFFAVEQLNAHNPSGGSAAYAQSYALFTCAMAAGTTGGPIIAGIVKERFGWTIMTWALAAISISGAIPAFFFTSRSVAVICKEGMVGSEIRSDETG
jgi:MFS family permease